jgi:hypothetical protein
MMGQFANAAEIAISDPERYMALFIVLAVRSGLALDARQGLAGTDDSHYEKLPPDVQYLLLHNVDFVEKRFPEGKVKKRKETEGESDDKMSKLEQECARLRSEMSLNAQRSLDGLQVELTRGWRFKIAAACLVVSTLVSVFAVPLICSFRSGTGSGNGITFWTILFGIGFCALAGTLFAPFAHDAMACIRRIGR